MQCYYVLVYRGDEFTVSASCETRSYMPLKSLSADTGKGKKIHSDESTLVTVHWRNAVMKPKRYLNELCRATAI